MIHPQAIVHPEARIGAGVSVGPYSVIGPDVEIGADTWIGPHVVINGPTRIGRQNRIHQFCSLGDAPQHTGYKGEPTRLEIGDGNVVREFCSLNRGTVDGGGVTRVGRDNFLMAYCHIAHDCQVGSKTVLANGSSLAGHVHVGDHAVLGGFTLVHQYCRLGAHCMTAVNTVIFKDVPPFLICSGYSAEPHGINVRGLKRRNFSDDAIESLRRAYKILYRSGHTLDEALKQLDAQARAGSEVAELVAFIKGSERGIIR
ncbi:MAG: acyl-[acyl-carrier-protein]--UDP-N-acetylglucosamine O-acyltransferase [Candidatus Muproteobacteria bacterium RBG_16_65_31]|uniref:Acyl-[acyl-carrier-protein]--UDP-N-acetylglucosamine O-acyltransferase n=2 Tax=Candidatus Muproteobacteria TaxID=1817795 RepID=A0A1F6TIM0_9PROT|nr:MAG: acyl-[acyl-carrier-protein]--UDP-N-acetylglucosamine O-acyltransferase [Candidatus Muproteobacteria bacterium RBG_16_65_31]OGI52496.1 MAG: acyl-[acyl-carrier-protein]--UDP-N-acetylglucosamine O-acyltransferase [Candidatus Muproteobacteria bacterium RIFCSPHIGHO2_02_FULL_65_16]